MKKKITKVTTDTITVNEGEFDPCAWHKKSDIGAFHCSYCCPQCNPIYQQPTEYAGSTVSY